MWSLPRNRSPRCDRSPYRPCRRRRGAAPRPAETAGARGPAAAARARSRRTVILTAAREERAASYDHPSPGAAHRRPPGRPPLRAACQHVSPHFARRYSARWHSPARELFTCCEVQGQPQFRGAHRDRQADARRARTRRAGAPVRGRRAKRVDEPRHLRGRPRGHRPRHRARRVAPPAKRAGARPGEALALATLTQRERGATGRLSV